MNGLSLRELCCLFCCPPCPSRIAAKLAFLPPEPTYTFLPDPEGRCKLHLTERAEFQYTQRELDTIEVSLTRSSRGNKVGCMYIRCAPNPVCSVTSADHKNTIFSRWLNVNTALRIIVCHGCCSSCRFFIARHRIVTLVGY
uniref:Abhydrolase domain containing 17A, depalmitoylase n=1 Tax=Cyprinodon variegatus TaxID=28743 RepID=A0A3Q2DS48_CYPVA